MASEVQESLLDSSCSGPEEDRDSDSGTVNKHQDLDRDQSEPKTVAKCLGADAEHLEMPPQPADPCQATKITVKCEEEQKTEAALVPPPVEVAVPIPVPPLNEGKGAKRMMEDDADAFKEMPDVCQEAREPGRAMLLPDLFGEAQEAHSSLDVSQAGGCTKVEQAFPCLSNMVSENQRKRFRGFAYKETEGPQVAYERLQELLFQWLKPEARSKEEIVEQLVLEQFLNLLPEDVQKWVRERHPENGDEAVALAEDYQFLHPEPGRQPYPERARQRASARSWLR
ncbi:SCAN domain-containing protein 1-like [Python bivittatus]|uniref:SCAN domain-containing protein 1-like n=1 Tax=Python bivittatus TaxID=176946 RepID=A0A9F2W9W0_PYTBI|nr:SCAN domain-containing protein 1-like [Python bivittatus]XP_007432260.1 SCAN domain-containing protein 1-like [Python bivittatus]XP_007432261.1 SCAN domain-containing protein 1-like [Python bivittatus]